MNDEEFLAAFESCTLPKADWTHSAHIRMAWLYLGRHAREAALTHIREGIQRYNAAMGGPATAYHETITMAFAHLIQTRRAGHPQETFAEFQQRNPDLFERSTRILARYYSRERLISEQARATFVEPDREELEGT